MPDLKSPPPHRNVARGSSTLRKAHHAELFRYAASAVTAMLLLGLGSGSASAQAEKPTLTVYTYGSFTGEYGPGGIVKERFEAVCGCTLEWVETDDAGTLLTRLKLEGSSTKADVVLGLDTNLMAEAKATGLFAPHGVDLADLDRAGPLDRRRPSCPSTGAISPSSTTDPSSSPSGRASRNSSRRPRAETIVIQDPRTSTPGLGLLLWIKAVYGDQAPDAWRKLSREIVTVTQGWSEAYGLFLKGEAAMVLSYTTSPAYHVGTEGTRTLRGLDFPEGHYLQVEVAGMTTNISKNQDLARSFLRFMLSEDAQS